MPKKPSTAKTPTPDVKTHTFTRLRIERHNDGTVSLIEDTYEATPKMSRPLVRDVPSVVQYHVRVRNEEWLGLNRYGDCDL